MALTGISGWIRNKGDVGSEYSLESKDKGGLDEAAFHHQAVRSSAFWRDDGLAQQFSLVLPSRHCS